MYYPALISKLPNYSYFKLEKPNPPYWPTSYMTVRQTALEVIVVTVDYQDTSISTKGYSEEMSFSKDLTVYINRDEPSFR